MNILMNISTISSPKKSTSDRPGIVAAAFLNVLDGFITECRQRETLFPLLEKVLNTYQNCQSALLLKQLLQSTCNAVLDSLSDEKSPRKSALISQVQEYICLNFNQPELRLETIASHFFINPQHLSAVFSQESGVTLTSYINVCRMKKARQFLLEDSPSIQNVAALCGFSDSDFQQMFPEILRNLSEKFRIPD